MMSFHTMLDLETLATSNNAFIISIGAVNFNEKEILNEFYAVINTNKPEADFDVNPATVMWWMSQSQEARDALKGGESSLSPHLHSFAKFVEGTNGVWGNSSTFDNMILRNAYQKLNIKCPWHFRKDKCFRTLANMFPREAIIATGTQHNALDDARKQALVVIALQNKHGFKL